MTTANVIEFKRQPAPEIEAQLKEELVCELLTPEPGPMGPEEMEERRRRVAAILGRPFPRLSREELRAQDIPNLDDIQEWSLMDALRRGSAPDIRNLFR
ncbi:hypothetical protein [Mesorhizobium koreense]|uniref:hypothetical protein n=1 Tax=Mesorhizobium koreense TaxID=3074855 RepID=UPI00287BABDF|nr:hypothetical protein [Mesorhizobium sp. WR6]